MTAPVDICNAALSEAGARSTITSLGDASPGAVQCSLHYDRIRRKLLRSAEWGFARTQVSLSLLGEYDLNTSPYPWPFMYAYPADCLRIRYLLYMPVYATSTIAPNVSDPGAAYYCGPSRKHRFLKSNFLLPGNTEASTVILTNVRNAICIYTQDVIDPTQWDDSFQDACIAALAARIVVPLTGNIGLKKDLEAVAMQYIVEARVADGNEGLSTTDHTPDWLGARGLFGGVAGPYPWSNMGEWYGSYENMGWGA
jgi:hypothetical protein